MRHAPPGSTLGIVSPASPIDDEELRGGLARLGFLGYATHVFPHARERGGLTAGTDHERAADLRAAFLDPQIDAVVCSRGGYGCARLLPHLDFGELAAHAKPFVGYSDITTLHLALNALGVPTIYGPNAGTFAKPREPWVETAFLAALAGRFDLPDAAPRGKTRVGGRATGVVLGGCCRLIGDAIGTPHLPNLAEAILVLEDINEPPHRIDAMLTQFRNSGILEDIAGIVVGEFTDSHQDERPTWEEVVDERLGSLGVPLITHYPFGHVDHPLSLGLGRRAILDADAGMLIYERGRA